MPDGIIRAGAAGFVVPVVGVPFVTFHAVQQRVYPGRVGSLFGIDKVVCPLPVTIFQPPEGDDFDPTVGRRGGLGERGFEFGALQVLGFRR